MNIGCTRFDIVTDTGGDYQEEATIAGLILQMQYNSADTGVALDTGADLLVETVNSKMQIADYDNSLGQSWTRVPRVPTYDQTGTEIADTYGVVAHDRVRVTVNQSDGAAGSKSGTLFIWAGF